MLIHRPKHTEEMLKYIFDRRNAHTSHRTKAPIHVAEETSIEIRHAHTSIKAGRKEASTHLTEKMLKYI